MLLTLIAVSMVVLFFMSTLFLLGILLERNDIADVGWGIAVILASVVALGLNGAKGQLVSLLLALVFVWCLRLSFRVFQRNSLKEEDHRYRWRRQNLSGRWFYAITYLQIYAGGGFLAMLVAAPLILASAVGNNEPLSAFSYLGAIIWMIGFAFEAIGDYQLDEFAKDQANQGKILVTGLWKWSRHPNYFGEILMWWGIWLIVLPLAYSPLALISPLLVTYLILRVSGIPAVEERLAENPQWPAYQASTSMLVPLPSTTWIGKILISKLN